MEFRIPNKNMEKFEKKMATFAKKCMARNIDFSYDIIGHDVDSDTIEGWKITYPVTIVEVTGEFKGEYNFVASIDHLKEGNIIRAYNHDIAIPTKYQTMSGICEHCGTNRARKYTYLVEKDGKIIQVGKNCLMDYTGSMSAEGIALLYSIYDYCNTPGGYPASKDYFNGELFVACCIASVKKMGFRSASYGASSTRSLATDYYRAMLGQGMQAKATLQVMEEMGIAPLDEMDMAETVIEWCKGLNSDNEYLHNLKIAFSQEWYDYKYAGLYASAYMAYMREVERQEVSKKEKVIVSDWIGEVGERIEVNVESWRLVTMVESYYGKTWLYEFITTDGNIIKWWTSKWIDEDSSIDWLRAKVKKHEEYRGVKSTVVNYCKIG